jgi:hypothetical protein
LGKKREIQSKNNLISTNLNTINSNLNLNSYNVDQIEKLENVAMEKIKEKLELENKNYGDDSKVKILSFSNSESKNKDEKKLFPYYCSLCGENVIVSDTLLEILPRRKTDESIIALVSKFFLKNYMKKEKFVVIKRDVNKYEKQYRYNCQNCGVFVAYQANDFEDEETNNEKKKRSNKIFSNTKRKILYILIDAVVANPSHASLFIEMEKINESKAKNKSFVRLTKTETNEYGKEKEKIVYL